MKNVLAILICFALCAVAAAGCSDGNAAPYYSDKSAELSTDAPHAHLFTPEILKTPTCTEKGETLYVCSCGESYTEETPAKGHDVVYHKARASTCTAAGYDDYETCKNCDYSTKKELPLAAHEYLNGKCTTCGEYELIYNQNGAEYAVGKYEGLAAAVTVADAVDGKPVTGINENAFSGCESLTEITIGVNVTEIGTGAFSGCVRLKSVVIPDKVTEIKRNTFYLCVGLEEITLPASLTYIDCDAFDFCRNLTTIRYKGTVSEWYGITIEYGWRDNAAKSVKVVCTDDEIEL